jgi:hypothetical protein
MGATTPVTPIVGVAPAGRLPGSHSLLVMFGSPWKRPSTRPQDRQRTRTATRLPAMYCHASITGRQDSSCPSSRAPYRAGKAAVGATRAGGGTGSGQSRANPLRSPPSAGGALEARMLTSQESPVLIMEDSSHFARLGVSVACGWNGPDVRRPLPS